MHRLAWPDENEGWSHRNFFKHIEHFCDKFGISRKRLRVERGSEIDLDNLNKSGDKFWLWFFMFKGLFIQILQRLADLPYLNVSHFLGDSCNLILSRKLPVELWQISL